MLGVFIDAACLSEEEMIVLEDWARNKSIVQTAMKCHVCERTVNRIRNRIREKYDNIQPYTDLPRRK